MEFELDNLRQEVKEGNAIIRELSSELEKLASRE
jgi:hypothetical protein